MIVAAAKALNKIRAQSAKQGELMGARDLPRGFLPNDIADTHQLRLRSGRGRRRRPDWRCGQVVRVHGRADP
eukprot:7225279-Alexandrium_andersonii.AAC.1